MVGLNQNLTVSHFCSNYSMLLFLFISQIFSYSLCMLVIHFFATLLVLTLDITMCFFDLLGPNINVYFYCFLDNKRNLECFTSLNILLPSVLLSHSLILHTFWTRQGTLNCVYSQYSFTLTHIFTLFIALIFPEFQHSNLGLRLSSVPFLCLRNSF